MKIEFGLLANACDSIERAIELIAWGGDQDDARRLKQAVQAVAHGIELLLKERLKRIHPSLIWEDVDKYPNLNARTVSSERAVLRLGAIGGLTFPEPDVQLLRSLRVTRNAIEHYVWTTTKDEANAIVGRALEFAFHFARTELGYEYLDRDALESGVLLELLESNAAFAASVNRRKARSNSASEQEPQVCDFCRAKSVDPFTHACRMCGHWQSDGQAHWESGEDTPF